MENAMLNQEPLVSIIIPYYNAGPFIKETVESVVKQSYSHMEILCVNDGSKDDSEKNVKEISDKRIQFYSKPNTGVSDTRNFGLTICEGEFVLFLDADDLLEEKFIEEKVRFLLKHPEYCICSSYVTRIDEKGKVIPGKLAGVSGEKAFTNILLYEQNFSTCPSIYLIRKEPIIANNIKFNTELSSSADRYFLLELLKTCKSAIIEGGAELYYRVHPRSMTGVLTLGLMHDNKIYFQELKKNNYIPPSIKRRFYFKVYYIFAGSYFHLRKIFPCLFYAMAAFFIDPFLFVKYLLKKS